MTTQEIHKKMMDTLEEDILNYFFVKKWVAEFKKGSISILDAHQSGMRATV